MYLTEQRIMSKKLKTLDEHNAEAWSAHQSWADMSKPQRNGIACPECGKELWDTNPTIILTSNPPKKNVHCRCGYEGYRLA
jgi:hypothetical protein